MIRYPLRTLLVCSLAGATAALAQVNAGVSDERVTLPQAPGSVAGVGENASVEGNQGAMQYAVQVEVPAGFSGLTPSVSLSYSSSGGASLAGMGWSMSTYAIERMTSKGLQKYDLNDRFVVDGAQELVRVAEGTTSATYRARFEGGFVRYTWQARGTGEGGWWKAEFPDGRVGYYGADAQGADVPGAQVRVPATARTFAWHLVVMTDQWGHQMKLNWTKDTSGYPLLERIDYLFEGAVARHSVRFTYEARPDVLSDARSGFELRLTQRLKDVRVFSGTATPEQIRRYSLTYETTAVSGGPSRLATVTRYGRGDVQYPVKFTFGYSKALGGACTTNCDKPFVNSMGTVPGVDFSQGKAVMVDINGDALPDVVFSDAQGRHQFVYGKLDAEGTASFTTTPVSSAMTTGSSPFVLGDARVQLLDVNGDGFVDLTQAKVPAVLCNNGSGDWVAASVCTSAAPGLPSTYTPEESADSTSQSPKYVRFFDYDNDKRIDWLRTLAGGTGTEVLVNTAAGFNAVTVDNIGAVFDDTSLQLADMNGDGLQDPVQLVVSGASVTVQYKLNLGFGKWTDWRSVAVSGLDATQAAKAELQDLNGDGLADLVSVTGNQVALVLNVNGDSFAPVMTLTSADLGTGSIPMLGAGDVVTYADMNGNGSDDIVWLHAGGAAEYLELFPVRPNLISRIDNGIGAVQLISYGTSIAEQARDVAAGKPWANRVPNAMVLVTRLDSYVTLTGSDSGGLHEVVTYRYHSGYYDGVEKQFRGYEGVENEQRGDGTTDAQEPTLVVLDFDVGKTDPAFASRTRKRQVYSLAKTTPALLREERHLDALCAVAEVPTTTPAVAFVCERATTDIVVEGDAANARTTQLQREYDGYGNVTREVNLGVSNLGTPEAPHGCEACVASGLFGRPCGEMCTGDEYTTETAFVTPGANTGNAWLLGKQTRAASGAVGTSLNLETRTYYDGPDFVGLASGQLTRGGVTRVARHVGPGANDFLDVLRVKLDATGNVVERVEPNGSLAGTTERRTYAYDPAGLWATSVELKLADGKSLRRELTYDSAFEHTAQASTWFPVVNGQPASTPPVTRWRYDEHGRVSKVLDPGDADTSPSIEYQYELADPATRILSLARSTAGQAADLVTASCYDGKGRLVQTRRKLTDTSWQVSGFTVLDKRGAPVRVYQPYLATSGACETSAPTQVPSVAYTYDALRRPLTQVEGDGSTRRFEYAPMVSRYFDEEASDATSAAANTPVIEERDGLGRLVRIDRTQAQGVAAAVTRLEYDADGNLSTVKDPAGLPHTQRFDAMGRLVGVTDPNSGVTTHTYDFAGNLTSTTDARSKVVNTRYDAANRPLAQWDGADQAGTQVAWTYDLLADCTDCTNAGGRLAQIEWKNGASSSRERFGYDPRGNLVFHEKTLDGHSAVMRYRYDHADRLTAELYPAGLTVARTWDGASRVSAMDGVLTKVDYTERDLPATLSFTNGTSTQYEYDARLHLKSLRTTGAADAVVLDLAYARNRQGDVLSTTDRSTRAGRARHGGTFTYDAWSRLTRAALEREGDSEVLTWTFADDDRITNQSSSVASAPVNLGAYTYDATHADAVSHAGALDYGYDEAGRVVTRGSSAYTWDHLGRLTGARRDGQDTASFGYGPGPSRVTKQEGDFTTWYVADDFELRDGIAVVYARLQGHRLARLESAAAAATVLSDLAPATGSGTLTPKGNDTIDIADAWLAQAAQAGVVTFNGGPTPSAVKALLASAARRLLVQDVTWLHDDQLESVVAATDAKGALVAERSFYPTGAERSATGFVDTYGFTNQEFDSSTGLVHFAFRELDPLAGRWTSVDPAFAALTQGSVRQLGQSTGGYVYGGNNFTNVTDPTGLLFGKAKAALSKIFRGKGGNKGGKQGSAHEHSTSTATQSAPEHSSTSQYQEMPELSAQASPYENIPEVAARVNQYDNLPKVNQYENVSKVTHQYDNLPKVNQYDNLPKVNQYENVSSVTRNQYDNLPGKMNFYENVGYVQAAVVGQQKQDSLISKARFGSTDEVRRQIQLKQRQVQPHQVHDVGLVSNPYQSIFNVVPQPGVYNAMQFQ